ncbi:hypothetical protein [Pedosphaera parvula]|nr:hypothetical protein [Pedosphaera parvula]
MPNRKAELIKKLKVAFPWKTPMKYKLLHAIYHHCGELVLVRHYGCKMVYLDPNNPGAEFADVQSNAATKKFLRENLRVKLRGFAAALTG